MAYPMGEAKPGPLRVNFDRRLRLEFHGSKITSDAGLLASRELDDALALTETARALLVDQRRGKNKQHVLTRLLRLSVDPAMRAIIARRGQQRSAASTSQMPRFETEWLTATENLAALASCRASGSIVFTIAARRS